MSQTWAFARLLDQDRRGRPPETRWTRGGRLSMMTGVESLAEPRRWFSWLWYWTGSLLDDLVRDGRLRRVDGYLTAA